MKSVATATFAVIDQQRTPSSNQQSSQQQIKHKKSSKRSRNHLGSELSSQQQYQTEQIIPNSNLPSADVSFHPSSNTKYHQKTLSNHTDPPTQIFTSVHSKQQTQISPNLLQKTIIITDQMTRKSCAISFKGLRAQIDELPSSSYASYTVPTHQSFQKSSDTFSLMGSHQKLSENNLKICPASLFYQTLILLFGPQPKQFLIESSKYFRPMLFLREKNIYEINLSDEVMFNQLKHRHHYLLVFQAGQEIQGLQSVAYTYLNKYRSAQAHNTDLCTQVLNEYPRYLEIQPIEQFLLNTELQIQDKVAAHCMGELFERDFLTQFTEFRNDSLEFSNLSSSIIKDLGQKTDLMQKKLQYMEKCQSEMVEILKVFDEQIDQFDELEKFNQDKIKKILKDQHIEGFEIFTQKHKTQIDAEQEMNAKIQTALQSIVRRPANPHLKFIHYRNDNENQLSFVSIASMDSNSFQPMFDELTESQDKITAFAVSQSQQDLSQGQMCKTVFQQVLRAQRQADLVQIQNESFSTIVAGATTVQNESIFSLTKGVGQKDDPFIEFMGEDQSKGDSVRLGQFLQSHIRTLQ